MNLKAASLHLGCTELLNYLFNGALAGKEIHQRCPALRNAASPLSYECRDDHYPRAICRGYHFWNHAVKTPISAGRTELIAPTKLAASV